MLGAIIGDIVGSRFEFNNHRQKQFELFTVDSCVTDDSIMTLAVAKALLETEKKAGRSGGAMGEDYCRVLGELTVRYLREIGRHYPHCGYGGMFASWMFKAEPRPYNSFGNGAAMRISPAGFTARTKQEAVKMSQAITAVTHNHPEGIKGAEAVTMAIFWAKSGVAKEEIGRRISEQYYPLNFTIDEIRPVYRFNETCRGTVPQAIVCFLEGTSFEDAIRTAISLGGDSDTIGAITGSIAEAYYGVPESIRAQALQYLDQRLRAIFDSWEKFWQARSEGEEGDS